MAKMFHNCSPPKIIKRDGQLWKCPTCWKQYRYHKPKGKFKMGWWQQVGR